MSDFTEEHPIEFVHGLKRMSRDKARSLMIRRGRFLANKLEKIALLQGWDQIKGTMMVRDLVATAVSIEALAQKGYAENRKEIVRLENLITALGCQWPGTCGHDDRRCGVCTERLRIERD